MTTNYLACGGPVCSQAATVNLLQSWWTTIKGARSKCNRYFSGMLLYHWWCFSLQGNNNILRDEGWKPLTAAHCRPQIWYRTHQNSNSTQFIQGFTVQGNKTSTICWSGGRVQVLVQVWAPACHHSRRLFQKTIEGFDCTINGQAFGAALCRAAPAYRWRVRRKC